MAMTIVSVEDACDLYVTVTGLIGGKFRKSDLASDSKTGRAGSVMPIWKLSARLLSEVQLLIFHIIFISITVFVVRKSLRTSFELKSEWYTLSNLTTAKNSKKEPI